ncbi:unnamed protein product, partial [Ectocarpus sp. 12 AP-2014]
MVPDKVEVGAAGTTAAAAAAATGPPSPTAAGAEVPVMAAVGDVAAVAATTTVKNVDAAPDAEDGKAAIDGNGEVAAAAAAEQEGGEQEIAVLLTVYPPQTTPAEAAAPLVLEPLGGMELVMQVRQLLGEIPQTCLYSAFRLVALTPEPEGTEEGASSGGGGDAVWEGEGDVMNDFVELRSIPAVAARPEKVEVRMELEPYTVSTARQHLQKFRELLKFPPPCQDGVGPGVKKGAGGGGKKGKGKSGGGGKHKKGKEGSANSGATASKAVVAKAEGREGGAAAAAG